MAMTVNDIRDLLDGNEGRTVHVEALGDIAYPGGYRSREVHPDHHTYLWRARTIAYFTTQPDSNEWDTYYELGKLTSVEVA